MYTAVIGDPIEHSSSVILHSAAFAEWGLDWSCRKIRVPRGELARVMDPWDPDCAGLAVTMPHKPDLAPFLDHVDGLAKATGAVNTVAVSAGIRAGFNTDVHGIVEAVRQFASADFRPRACAILGAGATAASAMAAARQLGADSITLVARRFDGPRRAGAAAGRLGLTPTLQPMRDTAGAARAISRADLVISTLPGDAAGPIAEAVEWRGEQVVLDVAYAPWPTPLARAALDVGACFVPGQAMLVHQAVLQLQVITSRTIDPCILQRALAEAGRWPALP